jgi:sulfate adenylyltransferase subunit 1 (EFTu-like GTPase family)
VSLLKYLETVPVRTLDHRSGFRLPVQRVVRPNQEFRGYAGTVAAGTIRPGDSVTVLPSGRRSSVASIVTFDGNLPKAEVGDAITVTLSDEVDVSRGDVIVSSEDLPQIGNAFEATLVWLNQTPAQIGRRYRLKHANRQDWAEITELEHRININTLAKEAASQLEMNEIARVRIDTARPLVLESYTNSRQMGSFILIDAATNATVAAGMITRAFEGRARRSSHPELAWRLDDGGIVLFSGADQSTLAALERLLQQVQISVLPNGNQDQE